MIHQLDLTTVILQQGSQPVTNPQVDAGFGIFGVYFVHVIPFFVGHHLQRQLVVVPQKQSPLAVVGNLRGLIQNIDDGIAIFHP